MGSLSRAWWIVFVLCIIILALVVGMCVVNVYRYFRVENPLCNILYSGYELCAHSLAWLQRLQVITFKKSRTSLSRATEGR
jgi:hypothetical protein